MQQETLESIKVYARCIWRYRWHAMVVTWLIVFLGWVGVFIQPITYTASAKVYVNTSVLLQPLLKDIVIGQDINVILGLVVRQLVSRPNVEQVAHIVGLDRQPKASQGFENMLNRLEQDILVEISPTSEASKQPNFFTLSYSNKDPKLAKQVVETLITILVEKTTEEKLRDSDAARQFLDQRIEEYRKNLLVAEARLNEFKRKYTDYLPESTNYFQRIQTTQAAVDDLDLQIIEAKLLRDELQRQLAQSTLTTNSIDDSKILALQKQLDEFLVKYTENHPDVIATKRAIVDLEKQQKTAPREKVKNLVIPNSAHELLKIKLGEAESKIVVLGTRRDEYLHRLQKLREMKQTLTQVELELQGLNQDYEVAKNRYAALSEQQNSANIGQDGEKVRFQAIDPPRILDSWPVKAKNKLLQTSGILAAGLAGGLAVAFFLSRINPVIYGQRVLQEVTKLPVFGAISRVPSLQMRMRKRLDLAAFLLIGIMLLGAHGLAVFVLLDTIKSVMIQELGGGE